MSYPRKAVRRVIMSTLMERINNEINSKAIKYGIMGTEQVSITLELSAEEKEDFLKNCMGKFNTNKHYKYELHDYYMLDVTYTEIIKTNRDNRKWIKVYPRNFSNEYFFVGFMDNEQKEKFMDKVNNETNSSAYTCRKSKIENVEDYEEINNYKELVGVYTLYGSYNNVLSLYG